MKTRQGPPYEPSELEILRATAAIREKWTEREYLKRSGEYSPEPMTAPVCSERDAGIIHVDIAHLRDSI
jgi:hypothetical protein